MRGEQGSGDSTPNKPPGSPPLARGTVRLFCPVSAVSGITPACAGNSVKRNRRRCLDGDHPRLRGEQAIFSAAAISGAGSPPLARGTAGRRIQNARRFGITPACAGNRPRRRHFCRIQQDHPRLRGEQISPDKFSEPALGSPPLARGTAPIHPDANGIFRITPACAGNSPTPRGRGSAK